MHTTYAVVKLKPEKNSGLNGIRTHDLWDTGAVIYQLSYQANRELFKFGFYISQFVYFKAFLAF